MSEERIEEQTNGMPDFLQDQEEGKIDDEKLFEIYAPVAESLDRGNIYEMRNIARAFGINAPTTIKKRGLIASIIRVAAGVSLPGPRNNRGARVKAEPASELRIAEVRDLVAKCNAKLIYEDARAQSVRLPLRDVEGGERIYDYGDPHCTGFLDIDRSGVGHLRDYDLEERPTDAVLGEKFIRDNKLRAGDYVSCFVTQEEGKAPEGVQLAALDGHPPRMQSRGLFEEFPAVYPYGRLRLGGEDPVLRAVDLLLPLGLGQRGLLFSSAGLGVTSFFERVADVLVRTDPAVRVVLVLLAQRPEEVTRLRRRFPQAVVAATCFDDAPARHAQMARLGLECAKRTAESGGKALLLLDNLGVLARGIADSTVYSGRSTRGGLDLVALQAVKRYFSSARKLEGAGSLTMLAVSRTDGTDIDAEVGEELLPAANLVLRFTERALAAGVFPAADLSASRSRVAEAARTEEEEAQARELSRAVEEQGPAAVLGFFDKNDPAN